MKKHIIVLLFLLAGLIAGCSGGGKSPVAPDDLASQVSGAQPVSDQAILAEIENAFNNADGNIILGAFEIQQDPVDIIKIVPYNDRLLSSHYNITQYLEKPYCPIAKCYSYQLVGYNPMDRIAKVDFVVYNPTNITVYDARVIFTNLLDTDTDPESGELYKDNDYVILNADGWTKILDNEEKEPDMNPYLLFNKEELPPPPPPKAPLDPLLRSFAGHTLDSERLLIQMPKVTVETNPVFLIEASYPSQAEEVIQYLWVEQRPWMDPSTTGFSDVTCGLFDHQGEDPDMHVYFSCPDVLGFNPDETPLEIEMEKWVISERIDYGWIVRVHNLTHITRIGEYPAMISAVTPNEGDFDTYYKFWFRVRHNPGGEGQTDYDSPIAYTTYETGNAEIFVSDNVFFNRTWNATNQPEFYDTDSCWARRGNVYYLYFASDVNIGQPEEDDLDIYVLKYNLQEGKLRYVSGPTLITSGNPGDDRSPCVSPNLDFMVFQGQQGTNGDWEIWRGNFTVGGEPMSFTGIPSNLTNNGATDENPTLNPFGNYMLYDSDEFSGNEHDIVGMSPTVMAVKRLIIDYGTDDTQPAWSPYDQKFFVFTAKKGSQGKTDLIRVELSGIVVINVKNLTAEMEQTNEKHASWSPSGQAIIFQSDKGEAGDWELWVMDWNGTGKDQITFNDFDETFPSWAPLP